MTMQATATVTTDDKGQIHLVVNAPDATLLPPAMVTKAKRGLEVQQMLSALKKEMDGLKSDFTEFFILNNVREGRNAAGSVIAVRTHGEPNVLNQSMLKAAHPKIVAEFTSPNPWDSVSFKA